MSATIGVDIGGTKIAFGVVTPDGDVVARTRRETTPSRPDEIVGAVSDGIAELRLAHDVVAVGVAAAGYIDSARSTVMFAPNLAWRDNPIKAQVEQHVDLPVVIENDANAAAWGEFQFGAARAFDDMLMLTVGTGLGGGLVIGRRLVRGAHGVAAEFGHARAVPDGHRCGCGNRGCWEQYISGTALTREAREMAASGSPLAHGILERAGGKVKRSPAPSSPRRPGRATPSPWSCWRTRAASSAPRSPASSPSSTPAWSSSAAACPTRESSSSARRGRRTPTS
jgi:glucokinase